MHVGDGGSSHPFSSQEKSMPLCPQEGHPTQLLHRCPSHSSVRQDASSTHACLLHCSNLGSHLYAHPASSSASEHGGWTPRHLSSSITLHLSSFTPSSQLCCHALGQRCGSRLSRSHGEAGTSLCTASQAALHIVYSDALTSVLQGKELSPCITVHSSGAHAPLWHLEPNPRAHAMCIVTACIASFLY